VTFRTPLADETTDSSAPIVAVKVQLCVHALVAVASPRRRILDLRPSQGAYRAVGLNGIGRVGVDAPPSMMTDLTWSARKASAISGTRSVQSMPWRENTAPESEFRYRY
jgi:hypothetical protein